MLSGVFKKQDAAEMWIIELNFVKHWKERIYGHFSKAKRMYNTKPSYIKMLFKIADILN